MSHTAGFMISAAETCLQLPQDKIELLAEALADLREREGRLFILGVGGSAANASHACCDFRKLCNIEAYSAADNVAGLTATTNDDGWLFVFCKWLEISKLKYSDAILVLSVGGGYSHVSVNLMGAIDLAKQRFAKVYGIVGDENGYTAQHADIAIVVPTTQWKTPLTESFQALVWHCLVSHPKLQVNATVW
jgi:D-sedoheptulose 7-phosphate isomerase